MLETTHTRDYYLSIAERYPLFEAVITGGDSLIHWLDCIAEDIGNAREETPVRLEALCELLSSDILSEGNFPRGSLGKILASGMGYGAVSTTLSYYAGVAALTLIPPPFGIVIGITLCCGVAPISGAIMGVKGMGTQIDRQVEKRKKALQPLYGVAKSLGTDISCCFILDDFRGCRDRFELTYRSLPGEGREEVDAQLYAFLGAGGMPGMDEQQLKGYLSGLLKPEAEGDA